MRWVIAALVVLGLVVGVVLAWPSDTESPPETLADATTTTTSTSAPSDTTTSVAEPTTTMADNDETSHVVETVEEAEEILRELWFGWFEGIYNEDEDRIREVVATELMLNAALNAFGSLEFTEEPSRDGMTFLELDVLEASEQCLAVWSVTNPSYLSVTDSRSGVEVLRRSSDDWKFASAWRFRNDLWEQDCESELQPLP